jgi:UDP-N-acetyl-D-mannosaminuronic acid transferase (WecB/TagA/CpsF family)
MADLRNTAREPKYDVLWPLSRRAVRETKAAKRLPDLNGKVVAELWDVIFRGETIYPLVREYIRKRFPDVKFVGYEEFGNFHGAREHEVSATIPDKLKAHKADAVIVGIGA